MNALTVSALAMVAAAGSRLPTITAVPEPDTYAAMLAGVRVIGLMMRGSRLEV